MADGDNIGGQIVQQLRELPEEFGKQAKSTVSSFPKQAINQIVNKDSAKEEAEKQYLHAQGQQRIHQLEAEIAAIARENEAKTGPEIPTTVVGLKEPLHSPVEKSIDIVSDRASHKVERDKQNHG